MPRGNNPDDASPASRLVLIRTVGVGLGIVLTAIAMWLIVTSTTQKSLEIGVLLGIWGVVIAASCAFSNRAHYAAKVPMTPTDSTSDELVVRTKNELLRAAEVAGGAEFQARLEQLIRTELRTVLRNEVGVLRAEVAGLRQELVDTVGGQLRLERVETTRVIGSNLETMHQELQRLTGDEPASQTVDAEVVEDPADVASDAGDAAAPPTLPAHGVESETAPATNNAASEPAPDASDSSAASGATALPRNRSARSSGLDRRARGGGRRRAEDAEDDVLARILARERR